MARPMSEDERRSLATPATASTLSSDMETSASVIVVTAPMKLVARPGHLAAFDVLERVLLVEVICRYIFQQTQSSRSPPARVRPMIGTGRVVTAAKSMRSTTAAVDAPEDHQLRTSAETREAARPTTMALSPASTTSIMMILTSSSQFVRHHSGVTTDMASVSRPVTSMCDSLGRGLARQFWQLLYRRARISPFSQWVREAEPLDAPAPMAYDRPPRLQSPS